MFKAKKQYRAFIEIAPAERGDLERIEQLYSDAKSGPLLPHHTKFNFETNVYEARSYWGALFLAERRAKAVCSDIVGGIDYIIVGVEEV